MTDSKTNGDDDDDDKSNNKKKVPEEEDQRQQQQQQTQQEQPNTTNLQQIKRECGAMMRLLTKLEQEETDLRCQNEVLARTALLCGFSPAILEAPEPKRRRKVVQQPKEQEEDPS